MRRHAQHESVAQIQLASWLDHIGVWWCHVPNGGARDVRTGARLRREGVKPGVPDCLIFDAPPKHSGFVGTALELKPMRELARGARVSELQKIWLAELAKRGWAVIVARGFDDARGKLALLGYG